MKPATNIPIYVTFRTKTKRTHFQLACNPSP